MCRLIARFSVECSLSVSVVTAARLLRSSLVELCESLMRIACPRGSLILAQLLHLD